MGLLSWFTGSPKPKPQESESSKPVGEIQNPKSEISAVPGMNGAVEVPRPPGRVTVFEFGSVAATGDKVTMAGYCPVSDDLEPCRWAIIPASGSDAPQFRVVF
ncbi:Allyl alcohol dehydrogenase-like protein [Melia azedarach]|uniref:Allyl alcohol dehydrogenase-like protein n=1 Tax=Melia azedarach TaxID=155640 RepID=A0ACC1Z1P2_MELAZ|nr:Allyl alcohol dehydrogenase-like protein [Melia azedarach]